MFNDLHFYLPFDIARCDLTNPTVIEEEEAPEKEKSHRAMLPGGGLSSPFSYAGITQIRF